MDRLPPSQADKRYTAEMTDQHGRKWIANIEMGRRGPSGPSGELQPRFKAPVYPPQVHFKFGKGTDTTFVIQYDDLIAERRAEEARWREKLHELAMEKYADKAGEVIANPPPALLALLGPKPQAWQVWDAARKGNKWVLGFAPIDAKPPWAEKYFVTYEEPEEEYPDIEYADEQPARTDTFPRHVGGPKWELSDGSTFKGTKLAAVAAEAALMQYDDAA